MSSPTARPAPTGLPALPGPDEPPVPSFPGEQETAGEFRLFVRRTPVAPGAEPAVYVHGLGGSSQNWSALMPLLEDVVDGEAVDLPGFGDSPPPDDGDYSVTGHARAIIRHLDAQGRGPVHLFGNSLGGAVATRVAAVRPERQRLHPGHGRDRQAPVEMREERAAARRLPAQRRPERMGIHRHQHEVALPGEVLRGRFGDLAGG